MGTAAVIGGGPGGLMAAERLARAGMSVTVYEQMPSVGRKFLLAGRGGLNITHSEPLAMMLTRYGDTSDVLTHAISGFDADALRQWCADLGEATFVGSSGRVFPQSMRATPLLRGWLARLQELGVVIKVRHRWEGWDDTAGGNRDLVVVDDHGDRSTVRADVVVLALGGASWPNVGSDGRWVDRLRCDGVDVADLRASNCGFTVDWTEGFVERFAGEPLKNVRLSVDRNDGNGGVDAVTSRSEAMITDSGIEGGGIYALGAALRQALTGHESAVLTIDLQPDLGVEQLAARLAKRRPKDSLSSVLRRAVGLSPVAVGLLREVTSNALPSDSESLARLIKRAPLCLTGVEPIERAISTAGGVRFGAVDASFMLTSRPGTFVVGEMLDWDAPTGGYLLQATFSTAVAAADGAIAWLERSDA